MPHQQQGQRDISAAIRAAGSERERKILRELQSLGKEIGVLAEAQRDTGGASAGMRELLKLRKRRQELSEMLIQVRRGS